MRGQGKSVHGCHTRILVIYTGDNKVDLRLPSGVADAYSLS